MKFTIFHSKSFCTITNIAGNGPEARVLALKDSANSTTQVGTISFLSQTFG